MDNIKTLLIKLDELNAAQGKARAGLIERQRLCNQSFDQDAELQKAISDLEDSQEYGTDDGGIYRWVRFNGPSDDVSREYLQDYLHVRGIDLDHKNGVLRYYTGPAIIINDDGDVFDEDGDRWILALDNYGGDRSKRAYLIEQYMEKTGCFPGVFRCDRHGNVFLEPTHELAKQYKPESEEV